MNNDEKIKKLEEFDEKNKHEIPPCDQETDDYSIIKLNKKDSENLKELLNHILGQLK